MRTRSKATAAAVAAGLVLTGTSAALAAWLQSGSGAGSVSAKSLAAPSIGTATVSGATVTVNWTPSAAPAGQIDGYFVTRNNGTSDSNACGTDPATPATFKAFGASSCTDTPGTGSYTYKVTAVFKSWQRTSAPSNSVQVTASTPPTGPSLVSLANGVGVSGAYINNSTKASVNFDVTLPASSKTSDVVHLTVDDAVNTVTAATQAGTNGVGTLHFTGLNLSSLADGTLNVKAWATNTSGASSNATASPTKDTVAPTATVTAAGASVTNTQPINFNIVFSENVQPVTAAQVTFGIPAGNGSAAKSITAGADAAHYTASVSSLTTNGSGDGNVTAQVASGVSDLAGNGLSSSTTGTVAWDRTSPNASSAVAADVAGTAGKAEITDTLTFTYSEAMAPSSLLAAWDGSSINVVVRGTDGGSNNDTVSVWNSANSTQVNLGTVTLGGKAYFGSGSATFGASGTPSTMAFNAARRVLTVTFGTAAGSVGTSPSNDKGALIWAPSTNATDVAGNAAAATSFNNGLNVNYF